MSNLSDSVLELAEKMAMAEIESGIAKAQVRQCDLPMFKDWDHKTCYDCGDEMISARLDVGRVRCVPCQEYTEHQDKLHGRS